jgi:Mrp family chromosome partitioning ATPase
MTEQLSQPEALDLRSYLRPIWRRKWIVLAITVVAAAATYLISSHQKNAYVSSTQLYVTDADPTLDITGSGSIPVGVTQTSLANVAQLMTAASITRAVSRTLGLPVPPGSVTATASSTASFVTVTATSQNPVLAARLANTYVSAFLRSRAQGVAAKALGDKKAAQITLAALPRSSSATSGNGFSERQTLLQQIETLQQVILNPSSGAQQVDTAAVPGVPASPNPKRDAIFGGVVGLVLGLLVAFCLDLFDRKLVTVPAVESAFGRPVLAVLPHVSNPTPLLDGHRAVVPREFVEELRSLTVMLRLGGSSEPPRLIMVTSTLPQEGKSTVTRDLALVYAEAGKRVLVIDGDLRRPSMERLFGIKADRGLVQILGGEASLSDVVVPAVTAMAGAPTTSNGRGSATNGDHAGPHGSVDVVAHGAHADNPLALLSSDSMVALLEKAAKAYDIVLLDTPPVLAVVDSVPLMEVVDSVLLVARLGQTTRHAAKRFTDLLERLSVDIVGVIANDRRTDLDDEGYGTYGRYGYYVYRESGKPGKRERKTADASEEKAGTTPS